jgi:hypothetical protein
MYQAVLINFRIALLVTIIGSLAFATLIGTGYPDTVEHLPGSYKWESIASPLICATLTVIFWFSGYKDEEGHLPAFLMAVYLLAPALGAFAAEAIYGAFYSDLQKIFHWYAGVSHLLYGLTNAREVIRELGKDAQ